MIDLLAVAYVVCFQACALPAIVKLRRRRSSADLAPGREWLLVAGIVMQLTVMAHDGATWRIWISPALSLVSVSVLLWHIYRYR